MTKKIESFDTLNPLSAKNRLNPGNCSTVHGNEINHYERLAMKPLDDQRCYETLNNLLTPYGYQVMTPKFKSIKNRVATPWAKKQSNSRRVPLEQGTDFDNYEHLSVETIDYQPCYTKLNDEYVTQTVQSNNYEHLSVDNFDYEPYYRMLNNRLKEDGCLSPMIQPLNTQGTTPTGSISSHSYFEIDTPIRNNKLILTIDAEVQTSPIEYGLAPALPIRKNRRSTEISCISSNERKPKTAGLISRAKKEKSAKTSLTQTSQIEEQRSDEKKTSQVVPSFKCGKLTKKSQSIENHETSPNLSPLKTRQNLRNESLFQYTDKSSLGKGFLSKCRNHLQNLTKKAN